MEDNDNGNDVHLMTEKMAIPVEIQQKQPHRRLPLELECEIYKCLKQPIQRKFIWGMGRGIYEMFGQKLLIKSKRLRNPKANNWNKFKTRATIAPDGLKVCNNTFGTQSAIAARWFPIALKYARMDHFPGTIIYYFEVTHRSSAQPYWECGVGLSDRSFFTFDKNSNSYGIGSGIRSYCRLSTETHWFEWPEGAIRPQWKGRGDVTGCGLVLNSKNKLSIFFTANGTLIDKQLPLSPSAPCLYPYVRMLNASLEANFGDDPENKPFKFNIDECPGLVFE